MSSKNKMDSSDSNDNNNIQLSLEQLKLREQNDVGFVFSKALVGSFTIFIFFFSVLFLKNALLAQPFSILKMTLFIVLVSLISALISLANAEMISNFIMGLSIALGFLMFSGLSVSLKQ